MSAEIGGALSPRSRRRTTLHTSIARSSMLTSRKTCRPGLKKPFESAMQMTRPIAGGWSLSMTGEALRYCGFGPRDARANGDDDLTDNAVAHNLCAPEGEEIDPTR